MCVKHVISRVCVCVCVCERERERMSKKVSELVGESEEREKLV